MSKENTHKIEANHPAGDKIYFLLDYNWNEGILISEGPKNFKIYVDICGFQPHTRYVPKDRCARPGEKVCVVWEKWRGTNGRGGYRVERKLYPQHRVASEDVARQSWAIGRVNEQRYGVEG